MKQAKPGSAGWPARVLPRALPRITLRMMLAAALLAWGSGSPPAAAQADPFSGPGTVQALKLRGLTARPAALMLSGQVGGPVPMALLAVPFPSAEASKVVALVVELGTVDIPDSRVEIYAYALDAEGKPRANLSQVFNLPPQNPEAGGQGVPKGAKFLGHLDVPPGNYELRVLVITTPSGRFGLQRVPLQVLGEPAADAPAFPAPPLIADGSPDQWTLVREAPHGGGGLAPYPFRAAGETFVPAARPVLADGDSASVYVLAAPGERGVPGGAAIHGRLEAAEAPLGELIGGPFQTAGSASVPWQWSHGTMTVESPARGLASLILRLGEEETPALEVLLASAASSIPRAPWVAFLGAASPPEGAASGPQEAAPEEDKDKLSRRELARVGREYEEVLRDLAAGRGAAARTRLAELEGEVSDGRSLGAIGALKDAELGVLRSLAQGRPGVLLPPARLHFQLLEAYTRDRRLLLSVHAREMFRALLETFVASAKAPEERRMAANLYARFGVYLQDVALRNESEETFRRALGLDPSNELALRALAASYERYDAMRPAVELLRQLRQLRAEDAEACVRLGRALTESGREAQGEKEWRACLDLERPAWAVELAHQELARSFLRAQRWADAEQVLRAAVERFPREELPALLLAYVLDRQQKPAEGRQVIARHSGATGNEASARYRYGRWPRAAFATVLRETDAVIDQQLPALAEVLADPKQRRSQR